MSDLGTIDRHQTTILETIGGLLPDYNLIIDVTKVRSVLADMDGQTFCTAFAALCASEVIEDSVTHGKWFCWLREAGWRIILEMEDDSL